MERVMFTSLAISTLCVASSSTLPTPPSLPGVFGMAIKLQSEPSEVRTCDVAFNRPLGNRLRVSCSTQAANTTKIFFFDEDILYELDGSTGKWKKTEGIPDSERNDTIFPLAFHVVRNRKVFDPNSLIHFDGESKRQAQVLFDGVEDWACDVSATSRGRTSLCTAISTWDRENGLYCKTLGEGRIRGACPLMALVSCNGDTASRLSVHSYTEDPDISLFQAPEDVDNATTTESVPSHASNIKLPPYMILLCLTWLLEMRLRLRW